MKIVGLKTNERKIFGLHILYSIIEGVLFGVMVLNEFVFVKSLKGTEMQLAILFQASVIVFVFTIVIHELLKRYKKKNHSQDDRSYYPVTFAFNDLFPP